MTDEYFAVLKSRFILQCLKFFVLNLNKNDFPPSVSRLLKKHAQTGSELKEIELDIWPLKTWFKETFQKGNRWNRSQIHTTLKKFTEREIEKLKECFTLIFNTDRSYNRAFIKYIDDYIEMQTVSQSELKIKLDQKGFEALLGFLGELKRDGKIQSNYNEIAKVLSKCIQPDNRLKISTIRDRLRNKKGYTR